jgi:flagellar biosynthetic protein FlhB
MGKKLINVFKEIYGTFEVQINDSSAGYSMGMATSSFRALVIDIIKVIYPILIVTLIIAVLGNMLQQSWMVSSEPMKPKFSKLNPVNGFKRIFSFKQVFELLKSIAMMIVIGVIAYMTIKNKVTLLLTFYNITLYQALGAIWEIIIELGLKVSAVFFIIGFVDLIYQRHKFKEDTKMTKQEVKDEYKNTEGDPQVKGQIRRRMQEISRRRMMQHLPEADVVITNPTHFAVALKYEPNSGKAPVVIAKGADYLAFQIKDKAREYHIEIVENKPLARILYANVDIGMEIPPELYQAVAEILAAVLNPNIV